MSNHNRSLIAGLIAFGAGFAVWAVLSIAAGATHDGRLIVREAWDTPAYFDLGLPIFLLVAAVAGGVAPVRVWRWPLSIAGGQTVAMILIHPPGTGLGLLPLAIVFVGLPLVVVLTAAGIVGALVARRGWDRSILA